jgi:hypothetical protein
MQSRQFFLFESALLFTKPAKASKTAKQKKRGGGMDGNAPPPTYEIRRTVEGPSFLSICIVSSQPVFRSAGTQLKPQSSPTCLAATELGRARVASLACCEDGEADAPFGFRLFLDDYDTALSVSAIYYQYSCVALYVHHVYYIKIQYSQYLWVRYLVMSALGNVSAVCMSL